MEVNRCLLELWGLFCAKLRWDKIDKSPKNIFIRIKNSLK